MLIKVIVSYALPLYNVPYWYNQHVWDMETKIIYCIHIIITKSECIKYFFCKILVALTTNHNVSKALKKINVKEKDSKIMIL